MPTKRSPLEALIELGKDDTSAERRALMHQCTDRLLSAPDRYSVREMEFFDMLYSNTARNMEQQCRMLMAASLKRAGLRTEAIRALVIAPPSMLGQILRRSATLPLRDLVGSIRERTASHFGPGAVSEGIEITLPDHRFMLPEALIGAMAEFIHLSCRRQIAATGKQKLIDLLDHAWRHNGEKTAEECQIEARDAILEARKSIRLKIRTGLKESYIGELLDTGHYLEFSFAMAHMLKVDTTTMLRILNDSSWDSLALACRANGITRACFSRIINAMSKRQGDEQTALRIMALYERIPVETARRTMRFWKVRVAGLCQLEEDEDTVDAPPQAANSNRMAATERRASAKAEQNTGAAGAPNTRRAFGTR